MILIFSVCFIFASAAAHAVNLTEELKLSANQWKESHYTYSTSATSSVDDFLNEPINATAQFALGYTTGFAAHEYGHETMANSIDVKMDWQGNIASPGSIRWVAKSNNPEKLRAIALSGLAMQVVSTELLLSQENRGPFVLGWLSFNIVNAINYVVKHESSKNGFGDIALYGQKGGDEKVLEALLIGHALWSGYRLINNSPPFFDVNFYLEEGRVMFAKNIYSW